MLQNTRTHVHSVQRDPQSPVKKHHGRYRCCPSIQPLLGGVEVDAELLASVIIERDQKINLKNRKGAVFHTVQENV